MNAIEIKGLTKRYKDFALEGLDLTLPMGCVLGLVGANGAGKSTTIRLIMDAMERDGGTVEVLGVDNKSQEFQKVKEEVGVVLDETCVPEFITARQLGKIMADTYRNWEQDAYERWLDKFQLPGNKKFKEYSRGMTMKLGIAAALSHRARLLLLDEATSGLDPMVREELLEVFADFAAQDGHAVLISSHIVSDLEKICDYVAFLEKGRLVLCEEKDVLLDRYGILKCGEVAAPPGTVRWEATGERGRAPGGGPGTRDIKAKAWNRPGYRERCGDHRPPAGGPAQGLVPEQMRAHVGKDLAANRHVPGGPGPRRHASGRARSPVHGGTPTLSRSDPVPTGCRPPHPGGSGYFPGRPAWGTAERGPGPRSLVQQPQRGAQHLSPPALPPKDGPFQGRPARPRHRHTATARPRSRPAARPAPEIQAPGGNPHLPPRTAPGGPGRCRRRHPAPPRR